MDLNNWKIISSYPRAEAVADGIQVRISPKVTKEAGIHFPAFLTRGVYAKYVVVPKAMAHQDEEGRLWDILFMFRKHQHPHHLRSAQTIETDQNTGKVNNVGDHQTYFSAVHKGKSKVSHR